MVKRPSLAGLMEMHYDGIVEDIVKPVSICPVIRSPYVRASEGIRTPDPLITNQPLYRLSYAGKANSLQMIPRHHREEGIRNG